MVRTTLDRKGKQYGQIHPWDRWFAGGSFRALRRRDFDCRTDTFIQQVRNAARRHGMSVSIKVSDDGTAVDVTATPRPPARRRKRA